MPVDFLSPEQEQRYGRYTGEPTAEQLARCFFLDDTDRYRIGQRRGDHTRLGFALQLGTVRFLGTFLDDPLDVPPGVRGYLARQLTLPVTLDLTPYRLGTVRWEHTAEIRRAYGYQRYGDPPGQLPFLRWLFARAWVSTERPSMLFDRAVTWLQLRKILLPGVTVLERDVARVRDQVAQRLWRRLAQAITPAQRHTLTALLAVPPDALTTRLDQLRRLPTTPSSQGLLEALQRVHAVRALGIDARPLRHIPASRLHALARFAATAKAQTLARMPEERCLATLLAFAHGLEATAHDTVLDLFSEVFATMLKEAASAGIAVRVRALNDLDAAALALADVASLVLDPSIADDALRSAIHATHAAATLAHMRDLVLTLVRQPEDTYYAELQKRTPRLSRFRPTLLRTITFAALPAGMPVLAAYEFLQQIEGQPRPALHRAPREVITRAWRPYVLSSTDQVDRSASVYCVFDQLHAALRRREVFVAPSLRYADPRLGMLEGAAWEAARPQVCRALDRSADAGAEIAALAARLDTAYRTSAAALATDTAVTLTTDQARVSLSLSPLDKLDEPPSLIALRAMTTAMLPQVDLPDMLLEIHRRTGFGREFTHISEAEARAEDIHISLCAVLVAEACNIGLAPLINPDVPALTRQRLTWVQQNYLRADTIARANARLVDAQRQLALAQQWGGGEVASADGLRFVVPIRTVQAGDNPVYFGPKRGVTLYNLASDQYTGLHGIVVTGTLRDSLVLLSLLLGQQTPLHPMEIMTDTAGYADVIFGLLWLMGYQFSPRISDIGGARFWRIDRSADYGALNGLAAHTLNTRLIATHWDELLRLAGSLTLGVFQVESLMRTLQQGQRPTKVAQALQELGRGIKTLFLLHYISDPAYRRRILTQLNRGEGRHRLARVVFHGQRGELRQRYREGQEDQLGALGLVVNIIVLWNTIYLDRALAQLRADGYALQDADIARLSPLGNAHLNVLGRYSFTLAEPVLRGEWRPFRQPDQDD